MLVRGIRSASRGIVLILVTTVAAAAQVNSGPSSSLDELIRQRVRYVFVIYQENRSFDHYFGTFPGANGIYAQAARAHGFRQYNPVSKRYTPSVPTEHT